MTGPEALAHFEACYFVTWNSCKKSHHSVGGVCKQFKDSVGNDIIVALQELSWHTIAGKG